MKKEDRRTTYTKQIIRNNNDLYLVLMRTDYPMHLRNSSISAKIF